MPDLHKPDVLCPFCGSADTDFFDKFVEHITKNENKTIGEKITAGIKILGGQRDKVVEKAAGSVIDVTIDNKYYCRDCGRNFNENQRSIVNGGYSITLEPEFVVQYKKFLRKVDLKDLFRALPAQLAKIGKVIMLKNVDIIDQKVIHVKLIKMKFTIVVNIRELDGYVVHSMERMWKGWL